MPVKMVPRVFPITLAKLIHAHVQQVIQARTAAQVKRVNFRKRLFV
jgi:hypothetical protein